MDPSTREAMDRGGVAEITTTGRRTGLARRVEIYFHAFDGEYYLTGRPGRKRDWEANIEAEPSFTLHLTKSTGADVPVVGTTDVGLAEKSVILRRARVENWGSDPELVEETLGQWLDQSPFVRFKPA